MSFALKLAWKYFRAGRKSLVRFTSAVAVAGIAAGVASLILAQGLARGFAGEMRDKILAHAPHVSVARADESEIADWETVRESIAASENVAGVAPASFAQAVIVGETDSSYAVLRARDPATEPRKVAAENRKPLAGDELAVGARLAEKLKLRVGDAAEVATLENQTPRRLRVAEIFATGLYDYDATWIEVAPELLARFRGQTNFTPRSLSISVIDIYRSDETAQKLREKLGADYRVVDWQEANRPLFAALSLERRVALAIISLIVFVGALNVTTTLALLVNERRLDVAILRTCGVRSRTLLAAFALEGAALALAGIAIGVAGGLTAGALANHFRLVSLPAEVYALAYVPLAPSATDVLVTASGALAAALAASLYPAVKASRLKPLENLRRR